ncbi:hypothetical protein WA026_014250 [Henosepilachna vigintioctopunctata]|uniref:MIF4G domain-containing protein n=1 Tax=Henosepilachna vigintioctopunctata TaxID=420089 RepID=A0AAW1TN94_9CUCU
MTTEALWNPKRHNKILRLPKTDISGAASSDSEKPDGTLNAKDSLEYRRLKELITTVTNDPEQFCDILNVFQKTLRQYSEDIVEISNISNLLVNQAVKEQSFRSTAARLCHSVEQESPMFRDQLYNTCNRELMSNSNKQGIVLFVAELFTMINYDNIYRNYLIDAFKVLLREGGDSNIECVCEALKLTGYSLDESDKEAMNYVFNLLKTSTHFQKGTALCLSKSVLELRKAGWGHSNSSEYNRWNIDDADFWDEDTQNYINAVYHSSNRKVLTIEETALLDSSFESTDEDST